MCGLQRVLQYVAVRCSVLHSRDRGRGIIAICVCCCVLQCVLQCVAVCCSALQCVAVAEIEVEVQAGEDQ